MGGRNESSPYPGYICRGAQSGLHPILPPRDDCGITGEPTTSGLFTRDMEPKPSFFALDKLINHEWKTRTTVKADEDGKVVFRGFKGRYRVSWKDAAGVARSTEFPFVERQHRVVRSAFTAYFANIAPKFRQLVVDRLIRGRSKTGRDEKQRDARTRACSSERTAHEPDMGEERTGHYYHPASVRAALRCFAGGRDSCLAELAPTIIRARAMPRYRRWRIPVVRGRARRRWTRVSTIVPVADRPWGYWWWINGNVDKPTITRDLEAMKEKGFAGLLLFDARGYHDDHCPPPPSRMEFMSPHGANCYGSPSPKPAGVGLEMSVNLSSCAGP